MLWTDNVPPPETISKLKPYQRLAKFAGISVVSNKNKLGRSLMKMRKQFPEQYNFFPQTYILPVEYHEFRRYCWHNKECTFIIKPEASCQGKGIFLTRDPSEVDQTEHQVAQKYLDSPLLIDDLKFDMRIYVLLYGVNPLRIFIYKEGLVRFATEKYVRSN